MQPWPLHLGLVRVNKTLFMRVIKSNAKTSVTTYTHTTTYIHVNVYSCKRCDVIGITKQKKKIFSYIGRKCSVFWNKSLKGKNRMFATLILMPRCRCRDFRMAENKLHVRFIHKKPACKKLWVPGKI